jgi:signal transduction histidine kinase
MTRRPLAGLRGRLLLALVLTSMVTLGAAAAVVLGPLQNRLRDTSVSNLETAVLSARPGFERAMRERDPNARLLEARDRAIELREQTDARVLVGNPALVRDLPAGEVGAESDTGVEQGFIYDTDNAAATPVLTALALRTLRLESTVVEVDGDDVAVGSPLFQRGELSGVMVTQRRLTEVTTAVDLVRNALLAAAAVGLLVAVALAVALSSRLLVRLGRLRAAALRITSEGPDAPAPSDTRLDEVGDLARALARMQEELRRQESARRAFVATASHELRTPLTMLQGTMELLEEDLRDGRVDLSDAQLQVSNARRELRRLSALAGELLDLSRLDAQVQLRSEPVELGELARAVAAEFELSARERDVTVDVVPPAQPCWGRGDPDAVARVVRILLDNAMRYGPPGEPVRVAAHRAGRDALIEVADRGPGVPPEERERIFERFHRGRDAGAGGGFGLGLAIGRGLAQRMGGALELADDTGPGARFVLRLAAVPLPDAAAAQHPVGAPGVSDGP